MDFVETEGDTIDAAIESALRILGVNREKVNVEVLSQGRKGILGFGSQKARIRAELRKSPVPDRSDEASLEAETTENGNAAETIARAQNALEDILRLMEFKATVEPKSSAQGDEIILEVHAENSGLLIGRKGQTLEALQYLVSRIAGEHLGSEGPHVVVDVENYRERRRKTLEDMALRLGEKAKRQRKTVSVDALSAADRRIIHAALQDDPWVTTKSLGQGAYRRLLIIPQGDRRTKDGEPSTRHSAKTSSEGQKASPQSESEEIENEN